MAVNKYRTFEEAQKALWRFKTDCGYFESLRDLFELFGKLIPPAYPHGVFKYKDLDEANRQRMEWDVRMGTKKIER